MGEQWSEAKWPACCNNVYVRVEIEAIVGDTLIAETEKHIFKFIDIKCICEVIIDRDDLLESIIGAFCS